MSVQASVHGAHSGVVCTLGLIAWTSAYGAPVGYGSADFWVTLKDLQVSEGTLQPVFDADGSDFELTVENPDIKSLLVTLTLDLPKYDMLMVPAIEVDGHKITYMPSDGASVQVCLNETVGPYDRRIRIRILDPHPSASMFTITKAAEHTYVLRVKQPPEYSEVIKIQNIIVESREIQRTATPPFTVDPQQPAYQFEVGMGVEFARVTVTCSQWATGAMFGDIQKVLDANHRSSTTVQTPMASQVLVVQCLYSDPTWTRGSTTASIATLTLLREVDMANTLISIQDTQGRCAQLDLNDIDKGVICKPLVEKMTLLGMTNNSRVTMFLARKGSANLTLEAGLPVEIHLQRGIDVNSTLVLVGGRKVRRIPLAFIWSSSCAELGCPSGLHLLPGDCLGEYCTGDDFTRCCSDKNEVSCRGSECPFGYVSRGDDVIVAVAVTSTCCIMRSSCLDFPCPWPLGMRMTPASILCKGSTCDSIDTHTCCERVETCADYMCPVGFVKRSDAGSLICGGDSCNPRNSSRCCSPVGNCSTYNCPVNKTRRRLANFILCEGSTCLSSEQEKCCVFAQTCHGYHCPKCMIRRSNAADIRCNHELCLPQDSHRCCSGSGWMLANFGESCDVACADSGVCIEEKAAWPASEKEFMHIAADLGVECHDVQPGESTYDPSFTEGVCGWKTFDVPPALKAFVHVERCSEKPPSGARRFCVCSGISSCEEKAVLPDATIS
eukprot:TRINITY_DN27482_c0_g1_i2.p1 TRINITY_DN27482_c0_g1~~TRINITY_DN27482_c0_g1_i2.p1  ORF type:complete len:723 (-),score=92.99 TRINITY_DN27482_c0_g1_i2:94-2262(-)